MSTQEPLRLEGFSPSLRSRRTLLIGPPEMWLQRMRMLEGESLFKGKSVLVLPASATTPPLLQRHKWSAVFRVKEAFDYQMLATYVQAAVKPVRILWQIPHGGEVPRAIWSRWVKQDVTLLGGSEEGWIGGCEWEAILFGHGEQQSVIEKVLGARGSGIAPMAAKLREHFSELTASGVALAWTNIDEADSRGGLYWYDPSEGASADTLTAEEATSMLESLARWAGGL